VLYRLQLRAARRLSRPKDGHRNRVTVLETGNSAADLRVEQEKVNVRTDPAGLASFPPLAAKRCQVLF